MERQLMVELRARWTDPELIGGKPVRRYRYEATLWEWLARADYRSVCSAVGSPYPSEADAQESAVWRLREHAIGQLGVSFDPARTTRTLCWPPAERLACG